VLAELAPSPVLGLSRAVAVAMAAGSAAGLELAADLEAPGALWLSPAAGHPGGLLRRLGRTTQAAASYRNALERAATDAGRRSLAGAGSLLSQATATPGHRNLLRRK